MDLFMVGSTWRSLVWQFMVGLFFAMYKASRSISFALVFVDDVVFLCSRLTGGASDKK